MMQDARPNEEKPWRKRTLKTKEGRKVLGKADEGSTCKRGPRPLFHHPRGHSALGGLALTSKRREPPRDSLTCQAPICSHHVMLLSTPFVSKALPVYPPIKVKLSHEPAVGATLTNTGCSNDDGKKKVTMQEWWTSKLLPLLRIQYLRVKQACAYLWTSRCTTCR